MAMQVRRVVTGHDETGKSIVSSDEMVAPMDRGAGPGVVGCEIWSTDRMPIDNDPAAEAAQKAGFVYGARNADIPHMNYVGTGGGSLLRIVEWPAGDAPYTHRTETMDYVIILSGEIDLDLDGDTRVHLKTGDTVVQRGGLHTWMNRGTEPAVTAFILIDATPVEVDGTVLRHHFPRA